MVEEAFVTAHLPRIVNLINRAALPGPSSDCSASESTVYLFAFYFALHVYNNTNNTGMWEYREGCMSVGEGTSHGQCGL